MALCWRPKLRSQRDLGGPGRAHLQAGATASDYERLPVPPIGSREGHAQHEGVTTLEETTSPDLQE